MAIIGVYNPVGAMVLVGALILLAATVVFGFVAAEGIKKRDPVSSVFGIIFTGVFAIMTLLWFSPFAGIR